MFSVLKNRDYAWLWFGQGISSIGDEIRTWAMAFWVFAASGHSPLMFTLAFIAATLPQVLVGPIAGVLVDRWDRRKVMITSDLARGVCSVGLIGAAASGQYLYALPLVFLAACAGEFFNPARSALVPLVVGKAHLVEAGSLGQTTTQVMRLVGPGLGTVIYVALGPLASFVVDSATFFLSALCITRVRVSGAVATSGKRSSFWADAKEGVTFAMRSEPVRALLTAVIVLSAGAGAINSLGLYMCQEILHLPESALAAATTLQGVGTLVSAVVIGSLSKRLLRIHMLIPAGVALCAVGIFLIAVTPNFLGLAAGCVVVGVGNSMLSIGAGVVAQTYIPNHLLGRVLGIVFSAIPVSVQLVSSGVAGVLAGVINARFILGGAGIIFVLGTVVAYAGLRRVVLPAGEQATAVTATAATATAG